jgi:FKBP-type peptidyl-prolyl cis-trans isomerase FkpA
MNKTLVVLLSVFTLSSAMAAEMTEDQKTLYAAGLLLGQQLSAFSPTAAELEIVKKGISDSIAGNKPAVELETYGPKIQQLAQSRRAALAGKQAAAGKAFVDKAAKEAGAVKTASGLIYFSLKEGTGPNPAASDTVKVNYRGTLIDGKEFDSSYKRGEPIEFPLSGVIKCWGEGVQKMKVGGKARLVCPASIAYGDNGAGAVIPPGATLNFEVELLAISKPAPAPAAAPEAGKK